MVSDWRHKNCFFMTAVAIRKSMVIDARKCASAPQESVLG